MAGIKFRNKVTFNNIEVNSGSFTNSGSTFIGSNGTALTSLLAGRVSSCFVATNAGLSSSGSASISNANSGDLAFITNGSSNTASLVLMSASMTAASTLKLEWLNAGTGNAAASTLTLQYLVVRTG